MLVGAGAELDKLQAIFSGYVRDRMMCAAGKGSGGRALAAFAWCGLAHHILIHKDCAAEYKE